ncbi:alkaline phosphatase [Croceicoccus estronivorus]|uniref:alkaline phosphatase D family protein n=1 Tax=Croceicoccus estronivorus TaxID=1172626 RepID=UPI00082E0E35|nr:alkaline phosphatase D family protein [Croceicoccus estronivorus]OCC23421.1 alkaline phosphatase [Croceicoccus estronivorus]
MLKFPNFAVSRRTTLAGLAGATFLSTLPMRALAQDQGDNPAFRHGVASGDPTHNAVVLWTRIEPEHGTGDIGWELARDVQFSDIVQGGVAQTGEARDYTIKILATGLQPGATYYYRFRKGEFVSPVGRTRTIPAGHLDRLSIALASCSNFAFGFFNAYDAIAKDPEVDFVLHTGDYIYEYGADGWGGDLSRKIGRVHEPAHEIISLADYRQRHAQYKRDAGSKAMHAAHPLMACWDDHESANNPWTGGAENHQPETEGSWEDRRAASIQAYYEWMPIREPEWLEIEGRTRAQFWRTYSFGDLATMVTLETRHTARARQIDYMDYVDKIASEADAAHLRDAVIGAEGRTMLSPEMEADLSDALSASVAERQPWRLIGNQIPIARTPVPDLVAKGVLPDPSADPQASFAAKALAWKGKWNLPFYPDTWDGYPWARERFYDLARKAGASDLIFLTGDSHSFWANSLFDKTGNPAGIELGTSGISSPGDFISSGFGPGLSQSLDRAFAEYVPEVLWTDNMHNGYVRLDLERDHARASFIAVDTVLTTAYRVGTLRRYAVNKRDGALSLDLI